MILVLEVKKGSSISCHLDNYFIFFLSRYGPLFAFTLDLCPEALSLFHLPLVKSNAACFPFPINTHDLSRKILTISFSKQFGGGMFHDPCVYSIWMYPIF